MRADRRRLSAACLASGLALALLAWLALDVGPVRRLDARILLHVSFHREAWVGDAAGVVGDLGNPWPQAALLAAAVGVGLLRGARRETAAAVVLVLGADLTTAVLKHLLATPRFEPILGYAQVGSDAFPSGHATAAFAMAAAWVLVVPPAWRPATAAIGLLAAGAAAASVVVLRYHFPSDALGGFLVATAWTCAVAAAARCWTTG
jgi:membrane-associated phospholipid phosphatase